MEHIAKTLDEVLGAPPMADGIAGWRAVELWAEIVGQDIASRSRAVRFADGKLYVEVVNSAWLQELSFLRRNIARTINGKIGREAIASIHFMLAGGGRRTIGKDR